MTSSIQTSHHDDEVRETAARLVAAFGAHDRDTYFCFFAPEASFIFYTAPRRLESRAEYETLWSEWETQSGFHIHRCASSNQRIEQSGGIAIFTHDVETTLSMDHQTTTEHERETIIFEERDGTWVATHEHLSPAPEA